MISLVATHLTCEYQTSPLGVDALTPRLSWVLQSLRRGERQTAYRVWVADSPQMLAQDKGDLWDSGKVMSSQSVTVPYAGKLLTSGEHCYWKVQVWDGDGQPSPASPVTVWQMGLLRPSDWKARWVSGVVPGGGAATSDGLILPPCPFLRQTFTLAKPVKEATLYATARGLYELRLNGAKVGDAQFAPGWTDYHKRIQYQVYDITRQLHAGPNALGAILGDGWYSGYVGYSHKRDLYGNRTALKAQINIVYADGTRQTVATDGAWRSALGPLTYSDLLQGEDYDARREQSGWDRPSFADTAWQPVTVGSDDAALLVGTHGPPVRVTQDLTPRKITQPTPGIYIFDLGQNMVGWARLRLQAPAGTQIQLRFGEMLNPDGTLYTANLRAARATDIYTCRGGGAEMWEPRFTFHGFRYVEVTGLTGAPTTATITGRVVGSDIRPTGTFACSSALVNQLQHNIVWGQRGNFLSVPTDCPQRDERLGWMGDAQIFARTATFNRDVAGFYEKWTQDVDDAQSPAGGFPAVSPRIVNNSDGAPAWADAGIIVPWTVWQAYGDTRLLVQRWPAMTRWMDYLTSVNPNGLWLNRRNQDFGDWLSVGADTSKDVLATAYYAHDAHLMGDMARVLHRPAEAARYDALFAHIKAAFDAAYVQPDGTIKGDTQTSDLLALHFGLLPEALRPLTARRLVADIAAKNTHLSTGFVGVGYLCPTLTDTGHNDIAYKLLLQDTFPSWGYSIRQGATTLWERWDGYTQDKGFQTPSMNSFNHYSLGSVGEWLYRYVAGIDTDPQAPGFARILIQPHLGPGLTWASASYDSIRGRIASTWKTTGTGMTLDVTIPANTTATVVLPAAASATVTESGLPVARAPGVTSVRRDAATAFIAVGSGVYHFRVSNGRLLP